MTEAYKFKFENIKLTDAVRLMLNGNESLGHLKFWKSKYNYLYITVYITYRKLTRISPREPKI